MPTMFGFFGLLSWIAAGFVFVLTFSGKGTDIQLILAALFGMSH